MRTTEHTLDLTLTGAKSASRFGGMTRAVKAVLRLIVNRRAVGNLSELDDYQLMDMGLRREDVRDALTSSYFADPGGHLTRASRNRADAFYRKARTD